MEETVKLIYHDQTFELPLITGSEGEKAIDITNLRSGAGFVTLDPGYANTGACQSTITFRNAEKGVLRDRGIPV